MSNLWYVLLTSILIEPQPGQTDNPGDFMFSQIMAATASEADCQRISVMLNNNLEIEGVGTIVAFAYCVRLPGNVAAARGWKEVRK